MLKRSSCNTIQAKARIRVTEKAKQGGSESEHLCQGAIDADQGGNHNRRGNSKILAREVEHLDGVGAFELLDRESKPIQVHLCMRDLQKSVQEGAHLG